MVRRWRCHTVLCAASDIGPGRFLFESHHLQAVFRVRVDEVIGIYRHFPEFRELGYFADWSEVGLVWGFAGLVTNAILFCRLFKIKDQCKKVRFQQTHNQGLRHLLLTVS